jgi:hypothetical protein
MERMSIIGASFLAAVALPAHVARTVRTSPAARSGRSRGSPGPRRAAPGPGRLPLEIHALEVVPEDLDLVGRPVPVGDVQRPKSAAAT